MRIFTNWGIISVILVQVIVAPPTEFENRAIDISWVDENDAGLAPVKYDVEGFERFDGKCEKEPYKACKWCSFQTCHKLCRDDDECYTFAYRYKEDYQWCRLSRGRCEREDVTTGIWEGDTWATYSKPYKTVYPSITGYYQYPGACKGLGNLQFCNRCNKLKICANACNAYRKCNGFVFNFRFGTCLLKDIVCDVGDKDYVTLNTKEWERIRMYRKILPNPPDQVLKRK